MQFSLPRTTRYVIPGASSGGPATVVLSGSLNEFLPSPSSVARDHRDIVFTSSHDGGRTWSPKVRVNDDPPGADQALPTVAVDEAGRVHVAWMDRRDGPLPGHTASPYWTTSSDGGFTFQPSRRLNSPGSDYAGFESRGAIGDFIGMLADGPTVYVAWPQVSSGWPVATVVRITDIPTSIAVPRFTAEPEGESVRVAWTVQDASGISSFSLSRAPAGTEDYETVATIPTHGTGEYNVLDGATRAGGAYRYRMEVQRGARSSWEGPIEVAVPVGIWWWQCRNARGSTCASMMCRGTKSAGFTRERLRPAASCSLGTVVIREVVRPRPGCTSCVPPARDRSRRGDW
jgi:hypothetical protein